MEANYCEHVKRCHKCQIYADNIQVPSAPLNVLPVPWPFDIWGIDVIGPIEPKASNGHCFILVAIDCFTKWVEAASYPSVTKKVVIKFIKSKWGSGSCQQEYQENSAKSGGNIQRLTRDASLRSPWYRTTIRTSTRATPYSLVYGMEAVLPVEVEIPSLRIVMEAKLEEAEWMKTRFDQLNLIEEKRLAALC
ncbi:hypothetical protein CR513_09256, partial [Mucuna pruriens]